MAKGLRNDTAHYTGAALPTGSSRAMAERRGVPGNARDILVDWFKDVKEEFSYLSIGQRATSPAQRTVGVTVACSELARDPASLQKRLCFLTEYRERRRQT